MLASLTIKVFSGFLEPGTSALVVGISTVDASAQCKCQNAVEQKLNDRLFLNDCTCMHVC